jgi:two-component system, chemotaxis family, CheB/CheR fusion protein
MSEQRETRGAGSAGHERTGASGPDRRADAAPQDALVIVGIGASAGGLEAFRLLLGALPPDTGMAFVVIQHLSPEHPSMLAKALVRFTSMPVLEIEDGTRLAPNRVYVMPSNVEVLLADGALRLVPRPASPGGRLPIDGLFRSLASQLHRRAIGVVLSGTGEDGTAGLKEIKAEGGITFAQAPASAQFSGMPESASAAGVVDRVLPPERIAMELARLGRHPYLLERPAGGVEPPEDDDGTIRILSLVRVHSSVDFTVYKPSTVGRRIARRMALHRVGSLAEYGDLVERDPEEAKALSQDLLIHVTGFFRDPEVFDALKRTAFPALLARKQNGPIRIWVPGCSTGEEVYSLAMSLLEHAGDGSRELDFQIFGSDVSVAAIERARSGIYPEFALGELGADRVERFFTRAGEERRISKSIRDRCVFVVHDLARHPPFAKLDLISCRNVLIYFGEELQRRIIPTFHYCLNRPGFVVLGRSENLAGFRDLFEPVDLEHRIFARVGEGGRMSFPFTVLAGSGAGPALAIAPARTGLSRPAAEAQRQADHLLLARFAPPGVVVNDRMEIVHFRGQSGDFLEHPPGQPQTNLLKMARGGLHVALRRALADAKDRRVAVRVDGVQVVRGDRTLTIAVEVFPLLMGREANEPYFLVLFHEGARPPASLPAVEPVVSDARQLREELAATKQYLDSMIEQHQAADDEFATVNEELIAANEELQSTNEELESAKEELQSANEELTTLNDELRARNSELDRLAYDLANILEAADIPIVIVDTERRIRRFTPDARALFTLVSTHVGRPIDEIKPNIDVHDLDGRIAEVMARGQPAEWEVQDRGGRWFRMKIRPYRAGARGLDGAVLSFVDVDALKRLVHDARSARDSAAAIVETVEVPLLVLDERERVVSTNPAFDRALGAGAPVRAGDDLSVLSGGSWDVEAVRRIARDVLSGAPPSPQIELQRDLPGGERRIFAGTARKAAWPGGRPVALLAFEDLTKHRRFEEERTARAAAETANRTKDLFLATLSHELRTPLSTILMQAQALRRAAPVDPKVDHASAAIHRAANLQKRLIDDLLDVSRIVSGKLGLDQHVVDLGAIVEGAVEEARPSADAKGVELHAMLEPGLTAVYADPARMQQVVSNLVTNAVKFTQRGGTVSVTLERSGAEGRISVRDTGIGIRREFLPLLFSRFSQADSTVTRTHGGLGLGLAIVKHLVDLHGGRVGAESDGEGRGATFWVTLPVAQTAALDRSTSHRAPPQSEVAGLHVLLIEDDEGTRECVVEILGGAGAIVRAAGSAAEGMKALREFEPDVLLSDLAMPGQDGFGLIAEVRSLPPERGGRIPAAALSALAGVEDRQRALAAGFQMHIPKPVDIDTLLATLARLAALRQT